MMEEKKILRYAMHLREDAIIPTIDNTDGNWVQHEDYLALAASERRMWSALEKIQAQIDGFEKYNPCTFAELGRNVLGCADIISAALKGEGE